MNITSVRDECSSEGGSDRGAYPTTFSLLFSTYLAPWYYLIISTWLVPWYNLKREAVP